MQDRNIVDNNVAIDIERTIDKLRLFDWDFDAVFSKATVIVKLV